MKVWYASQAKMDSQWKFLAFTDRGKLAFGKGELRYTSKKRTIVGTVDDVSLVRAAVPRAQVGVQLVIVTVMTVTVVVIAPSVAAWSVVGGIVGAVLGVVVNRRQRFVRVAGQDPAGSLWVAYFHVAKAAGWSGILGGNERLAQRLQAEMGAFGH